MSAAARRLSLQVQIDPAAGDLPADRRQLRRWVAAAAGPDAALVLRFVGHEEGRSLNRRFRGRDRPTNVLTFDYEAEPVVVADLILCAPVVEREARDEGRSLEAHYAHLLVHGTLHAQGHDHEIEAEAQAMETRETEVLRALGYADPYA